MDLQPRGSIDQFNRVPTPPAKKGELGAGFGARVSICRIGLSPKNNEWSGGVGCQIARLSEGQFFGANKRDHTRPNEWFEFFRHGFGSVVVDGLV